MSTELFIYYRVPEANAAAALAVVRGMHVQLRIEFPHLQARVLRHPELDKGLQTWMETYAIDAGIDDTLRARIAAQALALQPLIQGERHIEVFDAIDPCAS
ncbi:MAG TPA: DUF4936 family protein [Burkholderiaceae bacterium]|jgi:hypothetical protein